MFMFILGAWVDFVLFVAWRMANCCFLRYRDDCL